MLTLVRQLTHGANRPETRRCEGKAYYSVGGLLLDGTS